MSKSPTKSELQQPPDVQEISKWTRAYAQNRSLGVVVSMIIFLLLFAAIGGSSYFAGEAYRAGNMLLFWASIAALVSSLGAIIYLSIPKWGGKLQERLIQRIYAKEGNVGFSPQNTHIKRWGLLLGACFVTCILASVALDFAFDIPFKYKQPISALYVVPFLITLWFLMRPMSGYAALLWPLLYAIHAILILAGAPILFTGSKEDLNLIVPMAGYGMLAACVGHLYSRVALHKLKRLAQTDATDQPEEGNGE